jgi:hypothetical protein
MTPARRKVPAMRKPKVVTVWAVVDKVGSGCWLSLPWFRTKARATKEAAATSKSLDDPGRFVVVRCQGVMP